MNKKERERAEEDGEEKNKPEEAEANSRLRGRHKRKRERDKLSGPPPPPNPRHHNVHLSFLRRGSHAFDLTHSCGSLSPFPVEELCLRISKLSRIRRFF